MSTFQFYIIILGFWVDSNDVFYDFTSPFEEATAFVLHTAHVMTMLPLLTLSLISTLMMI